MNFKKVISMSIVSILAACGGGNGQTEQEDKTSTIVEVDIHQLPDMNYEQDHMFYYKNFNELSLSSLDDQTMNTYLQSEPWSSNQITGNGTIVESQIDNDYELEVRLPAHTVKEGMKAYIPLANIIEFENREKLYFSIKIRFGGLGQEDFAFGKGGKLPGLALKVPGLSTASSCKSIGANEGTSMRHMWLPQGL